MACSQVHMALVQSGARGSCAVRYTLLSCSQVHMALMQSGTRCSRAVRCTWLLCSQVHTALTPFGSVEQVDCFFQAPVCGGAFTLTFHINSDCAGTLRLLSKDIREEVVICELLPATRLSLTG